MYFSLFITFGTAQYCYCMSTMVNFRFSSFLKQNIRIIQIVLHQSFDLISFKERIFESFFFSEKRRIIEYIHWWHVSVADLWYSSLVITIVLQFFLSQ